MGLTGRWNWIDEKALHLPQFRNQSASVARVGILTCDSLFKQLADSLLFDSGHGLNEQIHPASIQIHFSAS